MLKLAVGAGTAVLLVLGAPSFGHAQAVTPPTLQKPDTDAATPDAGKPAAPALPSTGENLSERLGASGGVIKPPADVDPGIKAPPKDPGAGSTMPVIPPPGSPGGDRSVQPK
jgi:hypothetical protein